MYTADRTTALRPGLAGTRGPGRAHLLPAATLGFAAGAAILIDSAVDAGGIDAVVPNLFGLLSPIFGLFMVTAIYAVLTAERPGRLLDAGYLVNAVGLAFVVAIDFTRIFALGLLPDASRETLLDGPTAPALFTAATIYIVGSILFGWAMARRGFARPAAIVYAVTAVPSGLVVLLPDVVGALAQATAGLAIIALALELRRRAQGA